MKVPREVIDFLTRYSRYYIVGHEEPDGDCLGSEIGMHSYLTSIGKQAVLLSPGPFTRPEIKHYEPLFSSDLPDDFHDSGIIVLDCSTPERVGQFSSLIEKYPTLIIDHHAAGKTFGDIRWIDKTVPAVTLMIQAIFDESNQSIGVDAKAALLLGLATDTGFFRHLESEGSWVLSSASRLIDNKINPKTIYKQMYGNRSLNSRILLGRILSRITIHCDGKLIASYETLEDKNELGESARDSDLLYSILMGTEGMDSLFIIREESTEHVSVGLRSIKTVDVSKIARSFGGGGHMRAAGFQSTLTRQVLHTKLIEIYSDIFCHK